MRYLNKIIFINSASVKYAEIGLNGNVHLIGTQGVGKSTLLRAILFFYNANKNKLGISKEKKRFDDYYFEYQNSYIIYEVIKDNIPFCVLAYKVNGKVAFRFFNSEYQKDLFIDENGRAFENWEKTRDAFGKNIYYTPKISNYEEYRKIIYGDNKGLKSEFRKYALIESKQYQNIPRTIQNVLLNSNLEATFIKDTIINSINEEEFKIDIENYSKNHLRGFESQINDIKIWFKKTKKGQILIRNQAEKVIHNYRILNLLKREKKELAINLSQRINYIESEKHNLNVQFSNEDSKLKDLIKKKSNLKKLHAKREQDLVAEIKFIDKKLKEAKNKQAEYNAKNIVLLIKKVSAKESFISEQFALQNEKTLLTSQFSEIVQKYDALISQIKIQHQEFSNEKITESNAFQLEFSNQKIALFEKYNALIEHIKTINKEDVEKATNEVNLIIDKENSVKRKKAELKHQLFFSKEITETKEKIASLKSKVSNSKTIFQNAKNERKTVRKEWELEETEIIRQTALIIDKKQNELQNVTNEIEEIETKIKQSESSLYGWLNKTVPNWENTIGKVIDEKHVLFNTELNPKLANNNSNSFFGIELNLNTLKNRVKTVKEYNNEIVILKDKIVIINKAILDLNETKENSLKNLKIKFRKQLNTLDEAITTNEYIISQSELGLKTTQIELNNWEVKAKTKKTTQLQYFENQLELLSAEKEKATNHLEKIKKGINRDITKKEKERTAEINHIEIVKNNKIKAISTLISTHKSNTEIRIKELEKQQNSEFKNKGADTKRLESINKKLEELINALKFIKDNERTVFDYEKDKRELFDIVPQLKIDKTAFEKKQENLNKEHQSEIENFNKKYTLQNELVETIKQKIEEFSNDLIAYDKFKQSETFLSIQDLILNETNGNTNLKTAIAIISEINNKHFSSIQKFNELRQSTNSFIGNFNDDNIFKFKTKLNEDTDFLNFAVDLKEFIEEDKINEYENRVNQRFAHIIQQIGRETADLVSKEAEIEKIIKKINNDFVSKNFVQAIKEMEMRMLKSTNPVVKLLIQIKEFNDENSLLLGESNLFTTDDSSSKNQRAVELLKQLVKELEKCKNSYLTLSESFDLQFRIVENDNDSGWVEKLSNVGSEGTDVLVKAMINILLLNVFKESASKQFKDFQLHCMMDEIGRLHPNNVKGILRFANERNILLINGSPTSQNAIDYKYTYNLSKEQSKSDKKKYITRIKRLVKLTGKVINQ